MKLFHRIACWLGLHHGVIYRDVRTGQVAAHECWHCGKTKWFR